MRTFLYRFQKLIGLKAGQSGVGGERYSWRVSALLQGLSDTESIPRFVSFGSEPWATGFTSRGQCSGKEAHDGKRTRG